MIFNGGIPYNKTTILIQITAIPAGKIHFEILITYLKDEFHNLLII